MDRATYKWTEVAASTSASSQSWAIDTAASMLTIKIKWSDVRACIKHVLGYGNVSFNSDAPGDSLQRRLSRITPAKHPMWPWLRATKILSIQGRKPVSSIRIGAQNNTYGNWLFAYVSIQFETPRYPILDDNQLGAGGKEYDRYTLKEWESAVENLSRRGESWQFINTNASAVTAQFNGDLLLRTPKAVWKWTWYNVPEDWIMLGKSVPTNFLLATGKVNLNKFPASGIPDQNDLLNGKTPTLKYMPPGTLLLLPSKPDPYTQIHPNILTSANIDPSSFPRTYNVPIHMVYFNPPTDDNTKVQLAGGTFITTGGGLLIRGHNLVPLPQPSSTGFRFYAAMRRSPPPPPLPAPESPVQTDESLLYQYYDFERLFQAPRSLNDPGGLIP